jgi:hypothetical protein
MEKHVDKSIPEGNLSEDNLHLKISQTEILIEKTTNGYIIDNLSNFESYLCEN